MLRLSLHFAIWMVCMAKSSSPKMIARCRNLSMKHIKEIIHIMYTCMKMSNFADLSYNIIYAYIALGIGAGRDFNFFLVILCFPNQIC